MKIYNDEIAQQFNKLADLLEIEGANPFRIRAYRNAARVISASSENMADLVAKGADLTELPYIGGDLAQKITQIVQTGELPALKEVERKTPAVLSQLMELEGLGPKRVKMLYDQLKIKNIADLKQAIAENKLASLPRFGEKIAQKIKQSLQYSSEFMQRFKLAEAMPIAERLLTYLKKIKDVQQIEIAGSYRRRKETVGDLDILITAKQATAVIKQFVNYDEVVNILAQGPTKSSVRLRSGMQVDLRVVPEISYGAALFYFTGSKAHNIAIRKLALADGLKINEYGIYKKEKRVASKTEQDIYHKMGMAYIEPEMREDRGEIAAAQTGKLPKLIQLKDLRGDLHCHTNATDGANTLEEMANAAAILGHDYIAITDHSQHLRVANGLNKAELFKQIKAIDKLNQKLSKTSKIVILKSMEIDILEDGSLDLSDDILKELDLRVCSVHSNFELSLKKQTDRIIRAMDNPLFNILAHPTGRLIGQREAYAIDLEKVMQAANERGCFLEINSQPSRLDLSDIACKTAKEMGIKFAISSDAHSTQQLSYLQFGVYQARRGWLEASDVINTLPLNKLMKLLNRS